MKLDTVKIKADNKKGFMIINEKDFDKLKHELYSKEKKQLKKKVLKKKKEDK